ncbi:MAG TPA: hypothetical protein VET66_08670 [Steroidobacteraceae bacterium]|nr:hypothetical protein [Steroidobacteraceae bacterium]
MTRQARFLYAVGLSIAALGAAAAPAVVPPQLPVAPSTLQLTSTPDGDLHVTLNLNVKLTGISPLATSAVLACTGAVQPHNSVAAVVAAANGGTLSEQLFQAWFTASNTGPVAWNQSLPLTLSRGSYQGTQAVSFTVPARRLEDQTHHAIPSPALFVGCSLQLSDGTHTTLANLVPGATGQPATALNWNWIASGSNVVAVMQDVTFKPW